MRCLHAIDVLIHTAPFDYRGEDRVDITRVGADTARKRGKSLLGEGLAPSWTILRPVLDARRYAERLRGIAAKAPADPAVGLALDEAGLAEDEAWATYRPAYLAEMDASLRERRGEWWRLLVHGAHCCKGSLTFVCYCPRPERCHRSLAAEKFVHASHGRAIYVGERYRGR